MRVALSTVLICCIISVVYPTTAAAAVKSKARHHSDTCVEALWGPEKLSSRHELARRVQQVIDANFDLIVAWTRILSVGSLRQNVDRYPDILCYPVCSRASLVVEYVLELNGFKVERIESFPAYGIFEDHVFLNLEENGQTLIIDPSWLQFARPFYVRNFHTMKRQSDWIAVFAVEDRDLFIDRLMAFWDAKKIEWKGSPELLAERVRIFRRSREEVRGYLENIWNPGRGEMRIRPKSTSLLAQEYEPPIPPVILRK